MTHRTGYEIREGSKILAARRAEHERNLEVADAILKRWRIQRLAQVALDLVDAIERKAA